MPIIMLYHDLIFCALQDGKLRVFKWPSMEIILDEAKAHASVKDLDFRFTVVASLNLFSTFESHCWKVLDFNYNFWQLISVMSCSPDGKFLVSVGSGGPGRVWDVTSSKTVASLPKEHVSNNLFFQPCIGLIHTNIWLGGSRRILGHFYTSAQYLPVLIWIPLQVHMIYNLFGHWFETQWSDYHSHLNGPELKIKCKIELACISKHELSFILEKCRPQKMYVQIY